MTDTKGVNNSGAETTSLANWLSSAHNFWSFRHVSAIVPCQEVAPSPHPKDLPVVNQYQLSQEQLSFLNASRTDSLVIIKDNEIVCRWDAPGIQPDELHLIFSVTKSITSLLVGALATQGLLDIDAEVTEYLPQLKSSGFAGATIRNLLDMTAAYSFVEDYTPGPDILAYRFAAGWYPAPEDAPTLREFIATRTADGEHGQRFRYLSPTTDLLGWICEEVSGLSYAAALSKYIWQPMGAKFPALMTVDRAGSPRAAGGLSCASSDLARFGVLLRDGDDSIIASTYLADIFSNGSTQQWRDGDFADLFANGVYRSCCYRPVANEQVVMGIGIYGQMLYVNKAAGVVIAKQSSWAEPDETNNHLAAYELCRAITKDLA